MAKFKDYHAKYSEIVEGETDEADLARVVEELDNYADEVETPIYETLEGIKRFKREVKSHNEGITLRNTIIPSAKVEFQEAVRKYLLERDNAQVVIGNVKIMLTTICRTYEDNWIELRHKGRLKGRLNIKTEWIKFEHPP